MWLIFMILTFPLVVSTVFMLCLCAWLLIQTIRGWSLKPLSSHPVVGIMIPHYNEKQEYLLQSLDAIERQDYPEQLKVILVDDGSTNGVQTWLKEWLAQPRKQEYISVVCPKNNGSKGKAMDYAMPSVPADVEALVVVDSDTYLAESSVRRVVHRLWQQEDCAAVCGFIIPANTDNSFVGKLQYFEHIGVYPAVKCVQDIFGHVSVMAGAFVVHRMSAIKKVGGWSRWLVEDIAWTWAALAHGYRTGYAPGAVAYTYCPETHHGLFKQRRRWARGRVEAFCAAWQVAPWKGVLLTPMLARWVLSLMPPTLCLVPILAVVFKQWWVFELIAFSYVLYIASFMLYQLRVPHELRKGIPDILRSTLYNTVFEVVVWRPNLLGFLDEVFGKSKIWLTR